MSKHTVHWGEIWEISNQPFSEKFRNQQGDLYYQSCKDEMGIEVPRFRNYKKRYLSYILLFLIFIDNIIMKHIVLKKIYQLYGCLILVP